MISPRKWVGEPSMTRVWLGVTRSIPFLFRSPIKQNAGEIRGTLERARYLISIARSSLADVELKDTDKPGFRRFIRRAPLGVILVIAPWK